MLKPEVSKESNYPNSQI